MLSNRCLIEEALREHLPLSSRPGTQRLNEAITYSVFPGGKRIRPALALIAAKLVSDDITGALPAACAVEFLHTSSIIFDDLPSMDDADIRRGCPALHIAFGEDVAMLAALSLLNQSYALLACASSRSEIMVRLITEAASAIGSNGMIGGQAADLELGSGCGSVEAFATRNLKTTALMRLTMIAGAMACGANIDDCSALSLYGECLGAAYQIRDDILDETGESRITGKPAKQDARHLRSNFLCELGMEGAYNLAASFIEQGKAAISDRFGIREKVILLTDTADLIMSGFDKADALVNTARSA